MNYITHIVDRIFLGQIGIEIYNWLTLSDGSIQTTTKLNQIDIKVCKSLF